MVSIFDFLFLNRVQGLRNFEKHTYRKMMGVSPPPSRQLPGQTELLPVKLPNSPDIYLMTGCYLQA